MTIETGTVETPKKGVLTRGKGFLKALAAALLVAAVCAWAGFGLGLYLDLDRGARIYAELIGYAINTDATDFVLPNPERQAQCMTLALRRAGLAPEAIDLINTHGTATPEGDPKECEAIRAVFGPSPTPYINNTKSLIGHAMGAAGALELAGNLPGLEDHMVHPTVNCEDLDPACALPNLVRGQSRRVDRMDTILNNSFGMLGINAVTIVRRLPAS